MLFQDLPRKAAPKRLNRKDLHPNAIAQLLLWFEEAKQTRIPEFNALALATCTPEGLPSCRMVLIKEIRDEGIFFFTNYGSRKAREITANPRVAGTLFWEPMMRQIVIEGCAEKSSLEVSSHYFQSRPLESRLGAWASPQGQAIASYETLEKALQAIQEKFPDNDIPVPPFWGGYCIQPHRIEFWQGGENRLHDRFQYIKQGKEWVINRLAP